MAEIVRNYEYGSVPTVRAFAMDYDHFIMAIMGPVGSGKSSGCVMKLLNLSFEQQPDINGVRKTRWAIIRNTYQQLKDTTKKTIEEWVPFAAWRESENLFRIKAKKEDGTIVESEWLMRALDRPDQIDQLLSLELTGAWINEAKEVPREVFELLQTRVDRYPKREADFAPSWSGIILDTNPPDIDNWFYKFFEEKNPENAILYKQPSALSPDAENLGHHSKNYYKNIMAGKDEDFIRVYVHGEYGYVREGKAVFPNFKQQVHVSSHPLKTIPGVPLIIGLDCGLMPAAILTQLDYRGRLYILDELQGDYMSMKEFAEYYLKPLLRSKYMFAEHLIVGDPAGQARSQVDSRTVYMELKSQGLKAKPAKTNNIQARIGAVNIFLTRMIEQKPIFQINPHCTRLIGALTGKYCFRRVRLSGERYTDVPDKNDYSHIADALQYACLEHETGFFGASNISKVMSAAEYSTPDIPVSAWT